MTSLELTSEGIVYADQLFADLSQLTAYLPCLTSAEAVPCMVAGLLLVDRQGYDRPTDARRGALIRATEALRQARPTDVRAHLMLDQASRLADSALVGGYDPHPPLLMLMQEEHRRWLRAMTRTARVVRELLDPHDQLGFVAMSPVLQVLMAEARAGNSSYRQLLPTDDLPPVVTAVLMVPQQLACDGTALVPAWTVPLATTAQQRSIPVYLVVPEGPDPGLVHGLDFPETNRLSAASISAVVTSRGLYRSTMVSRYLNDHDTPFDVIPLK